MSLPPFPDLLLEDFDTRSGLRTQRAQDLYDADDHCRAFTYDPDLHDPDAAHEHTGKDSVLVVTPDVPNLVTDCQPQATAAHGDINLWQRTGVSVTGFGLQFTAAGQYATTLLGDAGKKAQFPGCDLVLAIEARARTPMTALTLNFGITDGHSSTFETDTKAVIDVADIGVGGYRRYYAILRNYDAAGHSTDVRIGVSTSGTFGPAGAFVDVTAVVVKPCSILPWWEPGYFTPRQHDWELVGTGNVPLWDDVLSFDKAIHRSVS